MNKYLIIVEGSSDAVFINDVIYTLLPIETPKFNDLSKFKKGVKVKIYSNPDICIFIAGGCTHVGKYKNSIQDYQDQNYKILMIQDADNPIKDISNGGVEKRLAYLESVRNDFGIDFQTFLFPDNKNDGDLEDVLLSVINKEKYLPFYDCYKSYSDCVLSFAETEHATELVHTKYLVYNYCQVYQGAAMANEKNRSYISEFWDLSHYALEPLRSFLTEQINF